ncbi:MAG: type I glyceraldehyde-3-phosphate dehydrogenase [Chloroflexota bacterium]|nr:type I glyceraldehyde-3-phosphate dehydrogenase [Chloroflexota bacterium]
MATKVAINGFGRIGRLVFRNLMANEDLQVMAVNDIAPLDNLLYLLKYDSVQREPEESIEQSGDGFDFGGQHVRFTSERDPADLPWKKLGVEIVIESTGFFTSREGASKHLEAGAKRVIISAPAKNVDKTICLGVNEDEYDPQAHILISNASCTTNCLSPVAKVLDETFGIESGLLTTVHAYTSSQAIVDSPKKKWRRGRAAAVSIVPTTTGAAIATTRVLPQLEGKMNGMALRVPVPTGSIIDFVVHTEKPVTEESVNEAFKKASETARMKGILGVTDEKLVSADIIGSGYSSLVDMNSTMCVGDHAVKVVAWYDNEWGYSKRCSDLAAFIARS